MRQLRARDQLSQLLIADALVHLLGKAEILVQRADEPRQRGAFDVAGILAVAHDHALGRTLHHHLHKFAIVLDVLLEACPS